MRQFFKGDDEKSGNINSEKEVHKAATYINQWRFRSIYNEKSDKFKIERISYFLDFINSHDEIYFFVNIFEGWIRDSITNV